jgi:hypothetical protein
MVSRALTLTETGGAGVASAAAAGLWAREPTKRTDATRTAAIRRPHAGLAFDIHVLLSIFLE